MISFEASLQVFVSLEPIDFRKGMNDLLALIESVFHPRFVDFRCDEIGAQAVAKVDELPQGFTLRD